MSAKRVVFIGAAGEMCRVAIERFALAPGDFDLVLADIRPDLLEPLVQKLPRGLAPTQQLDLFDEENLHSTVEGASLVVLGAGPYIRTSGPVVDACLAARVPYLDFDDDVESTLHALSLHRAAEDAGICVYVGCGASPGMSNVLAVDAASDLDTIDNIDLAWLVGDERPNVGRAVLEHLLHISAGDCVTWENGRQVTHETFVETDTVPILAGEPDVLLYETAHPEPVTLPRRYPTAQRIRCIGGLDPSPLNGLARGMGLAVQNRSLTASEAVDFIEEIVKGRIGSLAGWRNALSGMAGQIRRGESGAGALVKFLALSAAKRTYAYRGGLLARVYGTKDGKPAISTRRTKLTPNGAFNNMAGVTGTACAAFALLAIDQAGERVGAFAPEDWADPAQFYGALQRVGVPPHEIVETVH